MAFLEKREYPPGFPITARMWDRINYLAHWHSEHELVLVYEGKVGIGINSEYRVLEKGDIVLVSGGDVHYYDSKDKKSTVLVIVFHQELIDSVIDFPTNKKALITFLDRPTVKDIQLEETVLEKMKSCMDKIYHEIINQQTSYQYFVKAYLIELFSLFSRYIPRITINSETNSVNSGGISLVQKALKYLESNYSHDITLEDAAKYLQISSFYFSRVFSKVTGKTFKNYLSTIRVEKALTLIKSTNKPIIDIAYECGFNSIRTFNRVFKTIKGITPSSVR